MLLHSAIYCSRADSLYSFFFLITFSISMYIMYVILCLFSALCRRVGALQMSIIIVCYQCMLGYVSVFLIHQTLTGTTGSSTAVLYPILSPTEKWTQGNFSSESHPKHFSQVCTKFWLCRNFDSADSAEISGQAQSLVCNGRPSILWLCSPVINFWLSRVSVLALCQDSNILHSSMLHHFSDSGAVLPWPGLGNCRSNVLYNFFRLTLSLPWCHLKMTHKSAKSETLQPF